MPLTSLGDLTLPAESTDAEMAFRLVLGRRPARAGDLEAHLGKPLDEVLLHILRSAEFRQKVLPRLTPGTASPSLAPDALLDPPLTAWAERVL
ncbi:MAG: hypothetical protein WCP77_21380, partial [Roseococcus sp.]